MASFSSPSVRIAGYDAAWTRFELEVQREAQYEVQRDAQYEAQREVQCEVQREVKGGVQRDADGAPEPVPAQPIELFALSDPEKSIDAAALLRERVIADPPYWALVWTGARAIAAIASNLAVAPSAKVLDLGCGLGLAGLALAKRGVAVTFGDYVEEPLAFVRATLERIDAPGCEVFRIDFTKTEDDGRRYDVILAADIVYDPAHYAPLADYLDRHLAIGGRILLTESLRADARVFLEGMTTRGFDDEKNALWVLEDGRRERTWLHVLTRRVART